MGEIWVWTLLSWKRQGITARLIYQRGQLSTASAFTCFLSFLGKVFLRYGTRRGSLEWISFWAALPLWCCTAYLRYFPKHLGFEYIKYHWTLTWLSPRRDHKCNSSMYRNTYGSFTLAFSLKSYQEQSNDNIFFSKSWINVTVILESLFETLVDLVDDQNPKYWKQSSF